MIYGLNKVVRAAEDEDSTARYVHLSYPIISSFDRFATDFITGPIPRAVGRPIA